MRNVISFALVGLLALSSSALAENLSKKDFKRLKKEAALALQQKDTGALARVVGEMGGDDSERAFDLIAKIVIQEGDFGVYQAARTALAGMSSRDAVDAMCRALEKRSGDPRLKIIVIDAFTDRSDDASAKALASALSDRRPEVLRAAVNAITKRKVTEAVEPLLEIYGKFLDKGDTESLLAVNIYDALVAMTGRGFENIEDWTKYWKTVRGDRERLVTGDLPASHGTSERKPKPTFFGTEIKSNRLVFVIDISGSMTASDPGQPGPPSTGSPPPRQGPRTGDPAPDANKKEDPNAPPPVAPSRVRIERAKFQLKYVISKLDDRAAFTIIAYSSGCKVWKPSLQRASDKNKQEAIAFVDGLSAQGTTLTLTAMKAAFDIDGPDAIVLLSDGFPTESDPDTGGQMTNDKILSKIAEINRFKKWRVDTFGFSAGGAGMGDFMGDLAKQNNGDYTDIP